jgi:hypothetical protein
MHVVFQEFRMFAVQTLFDLVIDGGGTAGSELRVSFKNGWSYFDCAFQDHLQLSAADRVSFLGYMQQVASCLFTCYQPSQERLGMCQACRREHQLRHKMAFSGGSWLPGVWSCTELLFVP